MASEENKIDKEILEKKIISQLKTCYDPEIPVDIYELGMIYKIEISDDAVVSIDMTLTSPNCPVAETLPSEAKMRVASLPEVKKVDLRLVWEPPWNREMLSEEARLELGFY